MTKCIICCRSDEDVVSRREYIAVLKMLVRRATPEDVELAKAKPGHWLNHAAEELKDAPTEEDVWHALHVLAAERG